MEFVKTIKRHVGNMQGWRTARKVVVIESDDWGSIRMASKDSYNQLLKKGYQVDQCAYNRNDCLESNEDLEELFGVLLQFKDEKGNHPIITANSICANPDFEKIKESEFKEYHYELVASTLKRYANHDRVLDLYRKGIRLNIFRPQFHGREHVNIRNWMRALQSKDRAALDAFAFRMFTMRVVGGFTGVTSCQREFTDAFGGCSAEQQKEFNEIASDGLHLFRTLWGYRSGTFIAPCYVWHDSLTPILHSFGVHSLQGIRIQLIPTAKNGYQSRYRYMGMENSVGQKSIVRNVFFEPAETPGKDLVDECMQQIKIAFQWNKPAVICSHRMNFIGSINQKNRSETLTMLSLLLKKLLHKYPDIEFRSSDALWE